MPRSTSTAPLDIARLRLHNQRIAGTAFATPEDVVRWLGAVQAQDYLGARWAVGLRMERATEESVERALDEHAIIRTWPMRGTLHFVAAEDIRWMLELLTPRVVAANAGRMERDFKLDRKDVARSRKVLERALAGGRQLARDAVYKTLEAAGIVVAGQRGLHILWRLAQEGLVCFGAREGRQQTFVLLEEWAPNAVRMERDAALAELARRYFTGHGPATVHDFAWWSGLTVTDAEAGIAMARQHLVPEVIDGRTYWLSPAMPAMADTAKTAWLLPAYDEYTVAYRDRSAARDPRHAGHLDAGMSILNPTVVLDGKVIGTWKRELKKGEVVIRPTMFTALNKSMQRAVSDAAARYGTFLGLPVVMEG